MPSVVKALRAFDTEFVAWRAAADRAGESFNAWARRALNEQSDLDRALARERVVRELRSDGVVVARDLAGPAKPYPRGR